jgi:hypothetical protein
VRCAYLADLTKDPKPSETVRAAYPTQMNKMYGAHLF